MKRVGRVLASVFLCMMAFAGSGLPPVSSQTPAATRVCGSTPATAPTRKAADMETFREVLARRFDELDVPGLGFAVVADGRVLESGGLGLRDVRTDEPVTDATPFRVASLTKPVAAALLMSAVSKGRVDLDTPLIRASTQFRERCEAIRIYFAERGIGLLDGIPCGDERITLRSAATHTSRLPVGGRYSYNGFVFNQLTDAVAGPGRSIEDAFRAEVIEPLGLGRTAAGIGDSMAREVVGDLAPPHDRTLFAAWDVRPPLREPLGAAAGLIASARDMALIDIALVPGGLVTEAEWQVMTTPMTLLDGSLSPYGIGWFVQTVGGRRIVWHYGLQTGAYSALWLKDVEHGTSLVQLANSDGLTRTYRLGAGDLTRSPVARWFLDWSARRADGSRHCG